jgi:hypothetical protein
VGALSISALKNSAYASAALLPLSTTIAGGAGLSPQIFPVIGANFPRIFRVLLFLILVPDNVPYSTLNVLSLAGLLGTEGGVTDILNEIISLLIKSSLDAGWSASVGS